MQIKDNIMIPSDIEGNSSGSEEEEETKSDRDVIIEENSAVLVHAPDQAPLQQHVGSQLKPFDLFSMPSTLKGDREVDRICRNII